MDTALLAREIVMSESKQKNRYRDVAYELRNSITSLPSTKLPEKNLTAEDVTVENVIFPKTYSISCVIQQDVCGERE